MGSGRAGERARDERVVHRGAGASFPRSVPSRRAGGVVGLKTFRFSHHGQRRRRARATRCVLLGGNEALRRRVRVHRVTDALRDFSSAFAWMNIVVTRAAARSLRGSIGKHQEKLTRWIGHGRSPSATHPGSAPPPPPPPPPRYSRRVPCTRSRRAPILRASSPPRDGGEDKREDRQTTRMLRRHARRGSG